MRIYQNAYELFSEAFRDMDEMALIVKPKSYQNKIIEGNDDFITKEIQHYTYMLTALPDPDNLFLFEEEVAKRWVEAEFLERINPVCQNPGEAWKIRESVWEQFLVDGKFDYFYPTRINHQYHPEKGSSNLAHIINELARNPDTRQAYLPIFHADDVQWMGGKKRIPCSLGYYFMIRDGKVNMTYIQRSADLVQHFGNDVILAWYMKEYVTSQLKYMINGEDLQPGHLAHHIFSLHTYKKDWPLLKKGISNLTNYETE